MSKEYDFDLDCFNEYLECEYEHRYGEMYECPGGHLWHISDIEKQWEQDILDYNNTGGNL